MEKVFYAALIICGLGFCYSSLFEKPEPKPAAPAHTQAYYDQKAINEAAERMVAKEQAKKIEEAMQDK